MVFEFLFLYEVQAAEIRAAIIAIPPMIKYRIFELPSGVDIVMAINMKLITPKTIRVVLLFIDIFPSL